MTDHTDRPAPGTPVADLLAALVQMPTGMTDHPGTPVTPTVRATDPAVSDLLDLLGRLPADLAGQILEVSTVKCSSGAWRLDLPVATYRAGWALADAMGLSRVEDDYEYECYASEPEDPVTCWDGGWDRDQRVRVTHDARDTYPPRGPLDGQALVGHLTRLDEALRADPAAAAHLTGVTATTRDLRIDTSTTPAARDLAATLCPHAPTDTVEIPAGTASRERWGVHSWTYWEARCDDTTITGPSTVPLATHHDATDTAADDTYY